MQINLKNLGIILACLGASALVGCTDYNKVDKIGTSYSDKVILTLEDGCKIRRIDIKNSSTIFIHNCGDITYQCGKVQCASIYKPQEQPTAEELKEAAKAAALKKLTPAEREVLGLK